MKKIFLLFCLFGLPLQARYNWSTLASNLALDASIFAGVSYYQFLFSNMMRLDAKANKEVEEKFKFSEELKKIEEEEKDSQLKKQKLKKIEEEKFAQKVQVMSTSSKYGFYERISPRRYLKHLKTSSFANVLGSMIITRRAYLMATQQSNQNTTFSHDPHKKERNPIPQEILDTIPNPHKKAKIQELSGDLIPTRAQIILELPDWVFDQNIAQEPDFIEKLLAFKNNVSPEDHFYQEIQNIVNSIIAQAINKKENVKQRSKVICFDGPPGVGKTSICQRVAEEIDYHVEIFSCTNLSDPRESDIALKGSKHTYYNSSPGAIIMALKKTAALKKKGLIFVLDECEKTLFSETLLELLDPVQNKKYKDHHLGIDVDLSNIIFIATCNEKARLSAPLASRMEIRTVNGYTPDKKVQILQKFFTDNIQTNAPSNAKKKKSLDINPRFAQFVLDNNLIENFFEPLLGNKPGVRENFDLAYQVQNIFLVLDLEKKPHAEIVAELKKLFPNNPAP